MSRIPTDFEPDASFPSRRQAAMHRLPDGYRLQEFLIEGVIGEGGFSIVYLARDTRLQRRVALKEYIPANLAQRGADWQVEARSRRVHETFELGLRSFINEAQLLASFDHPSLIRVYRFWEENGTAYMVMPYVQAPTLKAWLTTHPARADERWIRHLVSALIDALEMMHAGHCYHRDIAPDNILLLDGTAEVPRPLLLDLGAARRVIGDATQTLTVIVKPGYAPIEQYAHSGSVRQGPWTDVYALCAVMYAIVTGAAPVPSASRVIDDALVPAVEAGAGRYTPQLLATIDAGLAMRPEARPQSMRELRAMLGDAPDEEATRIDLVADPESAPWPVRPVPAADAGPLGAPRRGGRRDEPRLDPSFDDGFDAAVTDGPYRAPAPSAWRRPAGAEAAPPRAADVPLATASPPAAEAAAAARAPAPPADPAAGARPPQASEVTTPRLRATDAGSAGLPSADGAAAHDPAERRGGSLRASPLMLSLGGAALVLGVAIGAWRWGQHDPLSAAVQANERRATGALPNVATGTSPREPAAGVAAAPGASSVSGQVAAPPAPPEVFAATRPAPEASAPPLAAPPSSGPTPLLRDILRRADPGLAVSVSPDKPRVVIEQDRPRVRVHSMEAGYLYVYLAGTDGRIYQWFPNRVDRDNRIEAGESVSLPKSGWDLRADGPAGTAHVIAIVSRAKRDMSGSAFRTDRAIPDIDARVIEQQWRLYKDNPLLGRAECESGPDCSYAWGAGLASFEEVLPGSGSRR